MIVAITDNAQILTVTLVAIININDTDNTHDSRLSNCNSYYNNVTAFLLTIIHIFPNNTKACKPCRTPSSHCSASNNM